MALEEVILFFSSYIKIISFIGAYIGGIETILFLGILAGQGIAKYWEVLVFAYLGYFAFEISWFWIARSRVAVWAKRSKRIRKSYKYATSIIKKITRDNVLFALFLSKIAYGAGIAILIYLSRKKLTFGKFMAYNSVMLLGTTAGLTYIGWLAGRGLSFAVDLFKDIRILILFIVVFAAVFHFIRTAVKRWIDVRI